MKSLLVFIPFCLLICAFVESTAINHNHKKHLDSYIDDVRLVGGSREGEGRIEIMVMNKWQSLCDRQFDNSDANVVCRQLGIQTDTAYAVKNAFSVFASPSTVNEAGATELRCTGLESFLNQCPVYHYMHTTCDPYYENAGVYCHGNTRLLQPLVGLPVGRVIESNNLDTHITDVRLSGGSRIDEGRVEIKVLGSWHSLCDVKFDRSDAMVVCRQLGLDYVAARAFSNARQYFPGPLLTAGASDVFCQGHEVHINQCPSYHIRHTECNPETQSAGVACHDRPLNTGPVDPIFRQPTTVRISLVQESPIPTGMRGVLVADIDGSPYYLCDSTLTTSAISTACRNAGFNYGRKTTNTNAMGGGGLKIWPGYFICRSVFWSLTGCVAVEQTCTPPVPALVECYRTVSNEPTTPPIVTLPPMYHLELIQLMNKDDGGFGSHMIVGTPVMTFRHVGRRAFCADTMSSTTAEVACYTMGYDDGQIFLPTEPTYMYEMWKDREWECTGSETTLSQCRMINTITCPSNKIARIACSTIRENLVLNLLNPTKTSHSETGIVSIAHREAYSYFLCANTFTEAAANVACKEFQYARGSNSSSVIPVGNTNSVWDSYFNCQGDEGRLSDCRIKKGHCPNHLVAKVDCNNFARYVSKSGKLMLEGVPINSRGEVSAGIVYVSRGEEWGTICDPHESGTFHDSEATIICKEMGYRQGKVEYKMAREGVQGVGLIAMKDYSCQTFDGIQQCGSSTWLSKDDRQGCTHQDDVYVTCLPN